MRNSCRLALTVGLAALMAAPALAQRPQRPTQPQQQQGRGFGGQGGYAALLRNESVQRELKLEADQVEKATQAVRSVQEKHRDAFAALRDATPEERRAKQQELNQTINSETLQALNDVLKPEQVKRLKQIELQQAGYNAFTRPDVQKALNLTDDQKGKINTIVEETSREMRTLLGAGPGARGQGQGQGQRGQGQRGQGQGQGRPGGENQEKVEALRKQTTEKVHAVLTDDQKSSWKEMTGEPFQVQTARRRIDDGR
jgi:hypothetical protein